jgi:hypothetical protein
MPERRYSKYTREKTWAALHSQHTNAGYALVPYSATNNSIALIRCASAAQVEEVQRDLLLNHEQECRDFYSLCLVPNKASASPAQEQEEKPPEADKLKVPECLQKAGYAVILAKSSEYHYYHLEDRTELKLVICGLHDSYLHLPVWEMRSNKRYPPRETAISITDPDFDRIRRTQFGHNILLGALVCGDQAAIKFASKLKHPTGWRMRNEAQDLQQHRYKGRHLAFMTEDERVEKGEKIRQGVLAYWRRKKGLSA